AVAAAGATAGAQSTSPVDEANTVTLSGNVAPLARAEFDRGAVADSLPLEHMLIQLRRSPERERALQKRIAALYDPHSPEFHRWLTAQELGDSYGPAKADVRKVTRWLESHGFSVNTVYPSGMVIDVSGSAGQVREAFHTEIHRYNVAGVPHIANAGDPKIPAALAPMIAGVASMHDFTPHPLMHSAGTVQKDPVTGKWKFSERRPTFVSNYFGNEQNDLAPADFATIYNINPLRALGTPITGAGQTIVVIEDTDMKPDDWSTFRNAFGLSSFSGTFTQIHPGPPTGVKHLKKCKDPGLNLDESEAALDAEWTTAVAPDAAIELASCRNTNVTFGGLIAAQNLLNSESPPPIISVSYGECEAQLGKAGNAAYNSVWQQAAAEGTSVFVAAGDAGASACDDTQTSTVAYHGIAASGFASTPYNVAVGGTDFQDAVDATIPTYWSSSNNGTQTALSYVPETPWNDSCASSLIFNYAGYMSGADFCNSFPGTISFTENVAGGGGPSAIYAKPSWQSGVVGIVDDGKRDTPDVSLFAGNGVFTHALLYCMSDVAHEGVPCTYTNSLDVFFSSAGGTSFAAPAFAGIQALINQQTATKWGNPNPVLYALAANEYGSADNPNNSELNACNANQGASIGSDCVFNDITTGDIDVNCGKHPKHKAINCFIPKDGVVGVLSTSNTTLAPAYPTS
ncbi:MAG TPA: S53 family peptidase, partial [Candidatus Binataceae bacterium]|nr:S53 family peptidase [Candidatus Binataceae bacterium]